MKLHLDYAKIADATASWVWALLVVSLMLAIPLACWFMDLTMQNDALQAKLDDRASLNKPVKSTAQPKEAQTAFTENLKQANAVLTELGYPWITLFSLLEEKSNPKIALLSLRPDATKGRIRIDGEAHDLIALLDYVRNLSKSGLLTDVVLEQHEVVDADAQKPVRFAIAARWNQ